MHRTAHSCWGPPCRVLPTHGLYLPEPSSAPCDEGLCSANQQPRRHKLFSRQMMTSAFQHCTSCVSKQERLLHFQTGEVLPSPPPGRVLTGVGAPGLSQGTAAVQRLPPTASGQERRVQEALTEQEGTIQHPLGSGKARLV